MKKVIFAAAIATMSTVASAQVSLGGKVSVWQDRTKIGQTTENSLWYEPTSNFAITAKENLGNGLTASAVIETSIWGNTFGGQETRLGDRQATVGVDSKVGGLHVGRNVHSQFLAITMNDAFGTMYGSVAGDVHNLRGLRFSDGAYVSVTGLPFFKVNYDRSQTVEQEASAASISASMGPVNGVVARYELDSEISTVVGVNAKYQNTTVFYSHSDNKGVLPSKGDLVSARQQIGAIALKASYGQTDADLKAYSIGIDYALSKRTEVGIAYRNVDNVTAVADVSQIGVGLTHRF
jgi:predicted porin